MQAKNAFQRLGPVNWLVRLLLHAVTDLPLPKAPEAAILAPRRTR